MPMTTKLGRVVTYHEGFPSIKSHDPLVVWSCKITWQTKFMLTPPPEQLWTPKLAGCRSQVTLTSCYPIKSHNPLNTWSCDITWQAKTIISSLSQCLWSRNAQCPDHVVLQSHLTNENHYTSTTRVSMATKLSRMVAHLDGLLPIKSHDSLIMWSFKIMWPAKTIIFPLSLCLWPQNMVKWWLILKGS